MSHVSVQKVWMAYGRHVVLEGIDLEIPSGEFCVLVGPSGAGKTTLLRLLLAMENPTRGRILIDGVPRPPEPGADRGVVFQRYTIFPHLTVLGNVMLGLEFAASPCLARLFGRKRATAKAVARQVLEEVGLARALDKYPSELSGGMQQRLSIAQALVKKPKVLLMDEPFGALDLGTKAQMHELVRTLWRDCGMTIVMVTHDVKEGFALGTRVVVLDKPPRETDAAGAQGGTITFNLPLDGKTERAEMVKKVNGIMVRKGPLDMERAP